MRCSLVNWLWQDRRHVRLLVTPELFFFIRQGEGGGPSLSDYICKFNKLNFSGRRPPPSCRTVSPRHIRVDRPWSCRSINIKKTIYVLRTKVARGFGLIYLIMEYILVRKLLDCRTKVHVVRVVDHLETCYIKFPIYWHLIASLSRKTAYRVEIIYSLRVAWTPILFMYIRGFGLLRFFNLRHTPLKVHLKKFRMHAT